MGFSSLTETASKSDVGSGLSAPNSNRPVRWPPGPPMTLGNNAAKEARQQHAWAGFLLRAIFPSGATYAIVGEAENGLPIVVRRRFSHWAPDTMRFKQMDMAEPLIASLATHHSAKTAVKGKSPLAAKARPIETCVVSAEQK